MSAAPTPRTYGRRYAWALVGGFTAASVALNAAHAVLGMAGRSGLEQILAALVAVVAPVSLLLATHLVVGLIRDWSHRRRWVTRLRALCAITTVGIGLVAFATSFVALMDMAALMGVPAQMTWALPAVVDAMIIIATLAVVVAEAEIALDQTEVAEAERRVAEAARVAEEQAAAQAVAQAELEARPTVAAVDAAPVDTAVDTVAPVVVYTPESIGLAAVPTPGDAVDSTPAVAESTAAESIGLDESESTESPMSAPTESTLSNGATARVHVLDFASDLGVNMDTAPVDTVESTESITESTGPEALDSLSVDTAESTESITAEPLDTAPVDTAESTGVFVDSGSWTLAEQVVDTLGADVDSDTVAEALRLREAGMSLRRIADSLEVGSHTTVRKWIKAAEEIQVAGRG